MCSPRCCAWRTRSKSCAHILARPSPTFERFECKKPRRVISFFLAQRIFSKLSILIQETAGGASQSLPVAPNRELTNDDVIGVLHQAHDQIQFIKTEYGIERAAPARQKPRSDSEARNVTAMLRVLRQINLMLVRRYLPPDVYERLDLATVYVAGVLKNHGDELYPSIEFVAFKQPVDVFHKLLDCVELSMSIADIAGVDALHLDGRRMRTSTTRLSNNHDLATILLSDIAEWTAEARGRRRRLSGKHAAIPHRVFPRVSEGIPARSSTTIGARCREVGLHVSAAWRRHTSRSHTGGAGSGRCYNRTPAHQGFESFCLLTHGLCRSSWSPSSPSPSSVGWFGIKMTRTARDLAHESGLGEAMMGALFIGASTSLSGIATSVSAAAGGHAELAVSNGLGGIAAQTTFLALADIAYRRGQSGACRRLRREPLHGGLLDGPAQYRDPRAILPGDERPRCASRNAASAGRLRVRNPSARANARHADVVASADHGHSLGTDHPRSPTPSKTPPGRVAPICRLRIGRRDVRVVARAIGSAAGTANRLVLRRWSAASSRRCRPSIPELVVAITAVRLGALNLAVGDIIGGNAFDTLFVAASDIAYRDGAIYASISSAEHFWLAISLLMTGVLLMGLIYRERHGPANIGLESVILLLLYAGGVGVLVFV